MKFLADENIPVELVDKLREINIDIIKVENIKVGLKDEEVIRIAIKQKRIIITFDKDFGELVYKGKAKVEGIILIRIKSFQINFLFQSFKQLIESKINIKNKFVVLEEKSVRIKKL